MLFLKSCPSPPGKPSTFATITKSDKRCLIFALPGNPVSGTVCTQLLVKPCLDLLYNGVAVDLPESLDSQLESIVQDALVHPELVGKLSHDIKLDSVRPEYHRVIVDGLQKGSITVSSTGVQRSSRLMSLRDATGLIVLPVGSTTKPKALKGDQFPVLITGRSTILEQTQVKNSLHMSAKPKAKQMKVAVVAVCKNGRIAGRIDSICDCVKNALSGSKSGQAVIVSRKTFIGNLENLYTFCIDSNDADLIVVACATPPGSYLYNLDVSFTLLKRLHKAADAIALQARQGVASSNAQLAIFEAVVGYAPEQQGAMMACIPEDGIDGGLSNIRGLLKHALNVARGKAHHHHITNETSRPSARLSSNGSFMS